MADVNLNRNRKRTFQYKKKVMKLVQQFPEDKLYKQLLEFRGNYDDTMTEFISQELQKLKNPFERYNERLKANSND
jgi:hypothetical protein